MFFVMITLIRIFVYLYCTFFITSCASDNPVVDNDIEDNDVGNVDGDNNRLPVIAAANANNNASITTHWLSSGNMRIGITSNGGGVINQIELNGQKIMGEASQMYGRVGQSCIRDESHNRKYNPTQAGFNETIGTPCIISEINKKLVIEPRQCALWHGDSQYDFCEWENIGSDPYKDDGLNGKLGYGSDKDGLNEKNLKNKQLDEVGSEFDYYGFYEDKKGIYDIEIPVIYHYYEYRYVREPGHCISQFLENGIMEDGKSILNESEFIEDISVNFPEGKHKGTKYDMNTNIHLWSLRSDNSMWYPKYRLVQKNDGQWNVQTRIINNKPSPFIVKSGYRNVLILSDTEKLDEGVALCIYKPDSDINTNSIIGVKKETNQIVYKDNRIKEFEILDQPERTPTMGLYGFRDYTLGILNPNHFYGEYDGIYEALRAEFYILSGTVQQIMDAIDILDKNYTDE